MYIYIYIYIYIHIIYTYTYAHNCMRMRGHEYHVMSIYVYDIHSTYTQCMACCSHAIRTIFGRSSLYVYMLMHLCISPVIQPARMMRSSRQRKPSLAKAAAKASSFAMSRARSTSTTRRVLGTGVRRCIWTCAWALRGEGRYIRDSLKVWAMQRARELCVG